ncbi:hypothetical protein F4780DRAFT_90017 [Xylariomycetidae sp. FL0641]|nr:hypothetical protein F4780DRAFT_90017 [Xylariomycetidae sp. FL0641]
MEWMSQKANYLDADLDDFEFLPHKPCDIQAIKLQLTEENETSFEPTEIKSEKSYNDWLGECQPFVPRPAPTLILVMHRRLVGNNMKAASVPYGRETLESACTSLFQHRSLTFLMRDTSNAIFNHRIVNWNCPLPSGRSLVYNCKSDDKSPTNEDYILMSVTCFPKIPLTFAVMYGCTLDIIEYATSVLDNYSMSSYHPLLLPMMFAEIERQRLLKVLRTEGTDLKQRIQDMDHRLWSDPHSRAMSEKSIVTETINQRDCKAAQAWVSVSLLKNGLSGLITVIESISEHSKSLRRSTMQSYNEVVKRRHDGTTSKIQSRLAEISIELKRKIENCDTLLHGMTLATQIEGNYNAKREAEARFNASFDIAAASKSDSSQMRSIAFLGMIFLPGTFLATFLSTPFFNLIPDQSSQVVSPWAGLFLGVTIALTAITIWAWNKWTKVEIRGPNGSLRKFDSPV